MDDNEDIIYSTPMSYIPCAIGHRFIWSGDSEEIPEGISCECGKTHYHKEICPTCGQAVIKAI